MAMFLPENEVMDGRIRLVVSLDQALTLLQVFSYLRLLAKPGYELGKGMYELCDDIRSIVGEENFNMIKCVETNDSGDIDLREIEEFCLELTSDTVAVVEEHKADFLRRYNNRSGH